MPADPNARVAQPGCPRCGYDQSGEIARWEVSCPLEGVCTECGLEFAWRDVLSPEMSTPRWCVENSKRSFARTVFPTLIRTLKPGAFWADMNLAARRRWARLVAFVLLGIFFFTAIAGIVEAGLELKIGWLSQTPTTRVFSNDPAAFFAFIADTMTSPFGLWNWASLWGYRRGFEIDFVWFPMFIVLCPVVYALIPTTLGRCRVRRTHLVAAFVYGLPRAVLWLEVLYILHWLMFMWLLPTYATGGRVSVGVIETLFATGSVWTVGLLVFQWRWWSAVNREYLRLDRPRLVTAAMLSIAGLSVLIPMFAFSNTGAEILFELLW